MTQLEVLRKWLDELESCDGCGRHVIEEGQCRRLEAAWDQNGEAVVLKWFRRLIDGPWSNEPKWMQQLGANARLEILSDLALRFEDYCRTGSLRVPTEMNTLDQAAGLFEIKVASGRVPFYESTHEFGSSRCTHGFYKRTQKTPIREILRGLAIARVDGSRK